MIACECGHRGSFYVHRILAGRVQLRCPKCGTVTEFETERRDDRTYALPLPPGTKAMRVE